MANTYTQIYLHFIFAVQNRASLIIPDWEESLHKYIWGIVENNRHRMIAVNGTSNHIHVFLGYNQNQSIPDLMKDIKRSSSLWINKNKYTFGQFNWQEGYGAFSYSHSQIDRVAKYILNQKEHHKETTFKNEYIQFLESFRVAYDKKYVLVDVSD
jgi:putative transposase